MALFGRNKRKSPTPASGTAPLGGRTGDGADERGAAPARGGLDTDPRTDPVPATGAGGDRRHEPEPAPGTLGDPRGGAPVAAGHDPVSAGGRRHEGSAASGHHPETGAPLGREGEMHAVEDERRAAAPEDHQRARDDEGRGPGRGTAAAGGVATGAAAGAAATHRHDERHEKARHAERHDGARHEALGDPRARQKEEYGGLSIASAFFGYLVAVGISVLVVAILGAAGTAIGFATVGSADAAEQSAGTIGIVGGVLLLVALAIAYYAGGYVAGRLARFDGAKQGFAVWVISILVVVIAGVVGAIAGSQYNVLNSLQLPSIPVSGSSLTTGGIIALVVLVVVTLLAAILGGKLGQRWHTKVDRVGR